MTDPPRCPKCQAELQRLTVEVNGSRWWKCSCDRKTYLIRSDGWIVISTGSSD